MTTRLTPYGSAEQAHSVSKVGFKKGTPWSLVARMPSPEIAAKVGPVPPPPPPIEQIQRVVRRNAR